MQWECLYMHMHVLYNLLWAITIRYFHPGQPKLSMWKQLMPIKLKYCMGIMIAIKPKTYLWRKVKVNAYKTKILHMR